MVSIICNYTFITISPKNYQTYRLEISNGYSFHDINRLYDHVQLTGKTRTNSGVSESHYIRCEKRCDGVMLQSKFGYGSCHMCRKDITSQRFITLCGSQNDSRMLFSSPFILYFYHDKFFE